MTNLLRNLLVPLFLLGASWTASVQWLRHGNASVGTGDLLFWFLLVPGLVVGVFLLVRRAFASKGTTATDGTATPAPESVPVATQEVRASLAIRHVSLLCAAGAEPAAALATLREGRSLAEPDTDLTDHAGLPRLSVRVPPAEMSRHAETARHRVSSADHDESLERLQALLASPLEESLFALQELAADDTGERVKTTRVALQVLAPAPQRPLVEAWIRQQARSIGSGIELIPFDTHAAGPGDDALRTLATFAAQKDVRHLLLVGCDTRLDHDATHDSQSDAPGEAAALIVVERADEAIEGDALAWVGHIAAGRRSRPLRPQGQVDASVAQALAGECLAAQGEAGASVSALVSDCGHAPAHLVEAALAFGQALPELDPIGDHLALGRVLGDTGAARSVLSLAIGATASREENTPILCATLGLPLDQSFTLLTPTPRTLRIQPGSTALS